MRFPATIALSLLLFCSGCASHVYYGGVYGSGSPEVTLVSALVTDDSPAMGYPLNPFPLPLYPLAFAKAGVTGEVTVRLFIGKDGHVKDAKIIKSSHSELADSVLRATSQWKFLEAPDWPRSEPKGLIVDCRIKFSID